MGLRLFCRCHGAKERNCNRERPVLHCVRSYHFCHCPVESKTGRMRHMKCRQATLVIVSVVSASIALADDFKTMDGKEYKDAKVSRVEPDGVLVKTKTGISKLYFAELPQDVQRRFNYDPQQATAYSAQQAATYSAIQKDQEQAQHQPQGAIQEDQSRLNEPQAGGNTGAVGLGQRSTPFPRHMPRYTTVLHQLPQTYAPTPLPSVVPMMAKTPKAPTTSNNPVHKAPPPATHPKSHDQKTHK